LQDASVSVMKITIPRSHPGSVAKLFHGVFLVANLFGYTMLMAYTTLISIPDLAAHLGDPSWLIVDARFSLLDPSLGRRNYQESHIPGAIYAHLDEDLSSPVIPGSTGRHPLPDTAWAGDVFTRWGVPEIGQVVVYDDMNGALAAVRVWWLLRWLGYLNVAVLDGGWQHWVKHDQPVQVVVESRTATPFQPVPRRGLIITHEQVDRLRLDPAWRLLDARAADRFRGENETIDPVAGHIPGAISAPYMGNLNPNGTFRSVQQLRTRYQRLIDDLPAEQVVVYCGSGVTSIHNILAMLHAGLGEARLYAGSWSEWITDPARPVAK
jgi:thiosulfate/3-mercaptopyruvate sulfurtransferase